MRERERERERHTHTHTTSHNIKSHQDKCMSNLNLRAKKTYKKQSTRKPNPRHKVHKQNQLTEGHFPWLPAKSPLIHSSWPKPRQIARPQAPSLKRRSVVHYPLSPSWVRARSLSLLSLALFLCPWRQEVNSCSHCGSSGTFWASSLANVFPKVSKIRRFI
jgi:hypothetical protein